jgi:hypothetical protein
MATPELAKFCAACGYAFGGFAAPSGAHPKSTLVKVALVVVPLFVISVLYVVAGILGWVAPSGGFSPVPASTANPKDCLVVGSQQGRLDEHSYIEITGLIRNNCGRRLRSARVTFKIFDMSGRLVLGSASAVQSGLDEGEVWNFKAGALAVPGATFKLDEVSGF